MKRVLLLILILGLLLPAAASCAPGEVFCRQNLFAEEDSLREQAISAALMQTEEVASSRFLMSGSESREEQYIVRFSETLSDEELLTLLSGTEYRLLTSSAERVFAVTLQDSEAFRDACGEALLYCCEDRVLCAASVPTDPMVSACAEYEQLELFSAWELITPSSDIVVAVLDTGVNRTHEDLAGATLLNGYDAVTHTACVTGDADGHGTAVTGLIAAVADNGAGSAGVAYGVQILPVRVANGSNSIYSSDLIGGIHFAADAGAAILNLSLGGYSYSAAEYDAVCYAQEKGCILIAAAGNDGETEHGASEIYPASYPGVISVGSCSSAGTRSSFSQKNDSVDLLAPGEALLLLATDEQGKSVYLQDSGTSYAAALVTGVAALVLSALDAGVRLQGEELLVLLADGRSHKGGGVGYGAVSARQAVEDANMPLITGVTNGATYDEPVRIFFNRGTATLDGEEFDDGDTVYGNGRHILTVTDGSRRQTLLFRLSYTPASFEMTEEENAVSFTYTGGTATLDGIPYEAGTSVTAPGWHLFCLTDALGDVVRQSFYCDFDLPAVSGVEDGGLYDHPVCIRIAGGGSAVLDGEPVSGETTVATDGEHLLQVSNGMGSKTYRFTLATGVEEYENAVSRSHVISDAGNGWYAIYSEMLTGLRVYDATDGTYCAFLATETVQGYAFTDDSLLIFGEWRLTVLNPAGMLSGDPVLASYQIRCEGFAYADGQVYCLSDGGLYTVSTEDGSMTFLMETDADELYAAGSFLWLYSSASDRFIRYTCGDGATDVFFPAFQAKGLRKLFAEGWLFCGGTAVRLSDFTAAFTFDGYAVGCTDRLLFSTNGVYRLSDGTRVGAYGRTVSCVLATEEETLVCGLTGGLLRYPSGYGFAPLTGNTVSSPARSNAYTRLFRLYGNASLTAIAADGDRFGAILNEERKLLLFSDDALQETDLPFAPDGIVLSEDRCCVWSESSGLLWLDGELLSLGMPVQSAFFCGGALYLLCAGRLYRYENGELADPGFTASEVTQAVGRGDVLAWLSGGRLYVRSGERLHSIACSADRLLTDGTYVLVGKRVYLAASLALVCVLESEVLSVCSGVVMAEDGFYALKDGSRLLEAVFDVYEAASLATGCGAVLYSAGSIAVSGFSYAIWEEPFLEGIPANGLIDGQTVLFYDRGLGYLDGEACPSGTEVTAPGEHLFTLVLPCAAVRQYTFTVIPALEGISVSASVYRLAVGETGALRIQYHPNGTSSIPVVYSLTGDCIRLESDGTFTALQEGEATITVETEDGRFRTSCRIVVSAVLLRFEEGTGYQIDREAGYLYGVSAGMRAEDLIAQVISEGVVSVSEKYVGTGTVLTLSADDGTELDRLTVAVTGDLDGDGFMTLQDLLLLEQALQSGGEWDACYALAADLSGNGKVSDQDVNLMRQMLLFETGSSRRAIPPEGDTGILGVFLPSVICRGDTVSVTLYLADGETSACAGCYGVSGRLVYDADVLTYLGKETYGWTVETSVGNGSLSFLSTGEAADGTLPIVTLRFSVTADAEGESTLLLRDGVLLSDGRAYGLARTELSLQPEERVYGSPALWIAGMTEPFSEACMSYEVIVPSGTPALDYLLRYPENCTVTARNTVFDRSDELEATFTFTFADGEIRTYTVYAVRNGTLRQSSDSSLAVLVAEGLSFPFDPAVTEYRLTVPYDMEQLTLHWQTSDSQATVLCSDMALLPGEETCITLTVTAEDGSQTIYTLRVFREAQTGSTATPPIQKSSEKNWLWIIPVLILLLGGAVILWLKKTKRL